MESKKDKEKLKQALIKLALGCDFDDVVEEYSFDEGKEILTKRKVTKKHYAPDVSAIKILLNEYGGKNNDDIDNMTDEELIEEKNRLLEKLREEE